MRHKTTGNSRFSQLRILFKPVIDFPLENLILAESTQSRTSQLTRSGGTLGAIVIIMQSNSSLIRICNLINQRLIL